MIEARPRWTLLLLAALTMPSLGGGCFSPNSVTCGDGRICPPDSRCDEQQHRCITNAQMLPCAGHAENDDCSFANAAGACRGGVCEPFFCGDGIIEASRVVRRRAAPGQELPGLWLRPGISRLHGDV